METGKTWRLWIAGLLAALATSANADDLLIGQTIALTGSNAEHGQAVVLGAKAYISRVNREGGVNGRMIALTTMDDGGDGKRAAENSLALIKQGVLALFGGAEGGPCVASMKVATEQRVPLVACLAGSPELREPFNRYAFPVRAPHYNEFDSLIEIAQSLGFKRIGFIHAQGDTGRKHLANVTKLVSAHRVELAAAIPLESNPDHARIVDAIAKANLDAVFNHGSYGLYMNVIKEAKKRGVRTQFLAINSGAQHLARGLGPDAPGLIFAQVVPFPWFSVTPIVKEYQTELRRTDPSAEPSFSSLEGFLSAKVLVEGLRRAGNKPTPETLVTGLEKLNDFDLGGMIVHFSPTSRKGSDFVEAVVVNGKGRFVR